MRIFFLLGILVFLISCGKENDGNNEESFNKNSGNPTTREINTETDPDKRLTETIDWYHVSCEKPMECPGYMAMLVAEWKDDLGYYNTRCSSFLIGDDVLATNAHCIPDDLKEGDSCVDRIYALFPKSKGKTGQKIGCGRILSILRDEDLGYDYAFLKLSEKTGREIPEVDQGERLIGKDVKIWKIDPRESNYGLVRMVTCKPIDDSLNSFESFRTLYPPRFSYTECENLNGNSGSPVLNGDGKVIGINQSRWRDYTPEDEFFKDLIPDGHLELISFGTNFGCLCKKEEGYTFNCENTPKSCRYVRDGLEKEEIFEQILREKAKMLLSEGDRQLLQNIVGDFKGYPLEMDWQFHGNYELDGSNNKSYKIYVGMVPKCIKSYSEFFAKSSTEGIWTGDDFLFRIPGTTLCEIETTFNSKLQIIGMKINPVKCFNLDSRLEFAYTNRAERTIGGPDFRVMWGYEGKEKKEFVFSRGIGLDPCPENSSESPSTDLERHSSFD